MDEEEHSEGYSEGRNGESDEGPRSKDESAWGGDFDLQDLPIYDLVTGGPGESKEALAAERLLRRGIAMRREGRYEDALEAFDGSIEIRPVADAWRNRAATLNYLSRYGEALESTEKAVGLEPENARSWIVRGFSLHNLGRYEDAVFSYARAIELDPNGPDSRRAWSNRGAALDNLHRHEEAIDSYDEAILIDPFDAYAWNNKGVSLSALKRYDEALKCFEKAIEIDPLYTTAWVNRAGVLKALGRVGEAEESLARAVEVERSLEDEA